MPTPGPLELVIILVIALLILGPGKLPDVGAALGKSIKEFRKASSDVQEAVTINVDTSPLPATPAPAPQPNPAAPAAPAAAVAAAVADSTPVAPAPVARGRARHPPPRPPPPARAGPGWPAPRRARGYNRRPYLAGPPSPAHARRRPPARAGRHRAPHTPRSRAADPACLGAADR